MNNNADSRRMAGQPATDDPYTEAPNSTVDDWLGQKVEKDSERADELVAQEHGDLAKAEQRFEQESEPK